MRMQLQGKAGISRVIRPEAFLLAHFPKHRCLRAEKLVILIQNFRIADYVVDIARGLTVAPAAAARAVRAGLPRQATS